jgi:nucleoside-diphosphate-sugar epimerase
VKVLVAGAGYVGTTLARELAGRGHEIVAVRRRPPTDRAEPFGWLACDLEDVEALRRVLPEDLDGIAYTAAADGRTVEAYERAYVRGVAALVAIAAERPSIRRFVFTTSTAVYGQDDGSWVDEASPTEPESPTARVLLEGERLVVGFSGGVVLRLGGIYGPARARLVHDVAEGRAALPPPGRFSNRIHVEDCAGMLGFLLEHPNPASIYLGVDREPAPLRDVLVHLARSLGVGELQEGEGARAERSRHNKRCRADRVLRAGYTLRFPTFREGYAPIVAALSAQG